MRYFLAFLIHDLTGHHRVYFICTKSYGTPEEVAREARRKSGWEDAEVHVEELSGPPVGAWQLPAYLPAHYLETFSRDSEEARFRRLIES